VAVYNNRALTHLKLKNYSRAKEDSLEALQILKNFKSYLRVSLAEYHLGQYQEAMRDIDLALEIEDKNKEALDLRKQIMEKWKDVDGVAVKEKISKSKKKLSIFEIEDFPAEQSDSKNSKKERQIDYNFTNDPRIPKIVELEEEEDVQIVDVDDDSSDDEMPDQKSKVLYANDDSDDEDE
jgi:tetratricopeptide (TPR) repeat protein